nr:probable gamma-secretase subunit PEN-2 isoform X1 [Arachis hypogaea]
MEAPQSQSQMQVQVQLQGNSSPNPNPNLSPIRSTGGIWPTIDGPLGLSEEESVSYARRFYKFGFALLPLLWAVNCFYFWPVLRHSRSFPRIRPYSKLLDKKSFFDIVGSAVGFTVFSALLCTWALTFSLGGERLFGPVWDQLVMYNLADRLGLTAWS